MADYADHIGETLIAQRRFSSLEHIVSERPCRQQLTRHDVHHLVGAVREFRLFPRIDGLDYGPVKACGQRDRSLNSEKGWVGPRQDTNSAIKNRKISAVFKP
jgi:hypothetical protein